MSISIREFQTAMEVFGAKRIGYTIGSRYSISVPCFCVNDVEFIHSGSDYVVTNESELPEGILNRAMTELGETYPGNYPLCFGEIHSVRGMLAIATILNGNYSKELLNTLTNETYNRLLGIPSIQSNARTIFASASSQKLEKLREIVKKYDNVINPYGTRYKLKQFSEYIGNVQIGVYDTPEGLMRELAFKVVNSSLLYGKSGIKYSSYFSTQEDRKTGTLYMSHSVGRTPSDDKIDLHFAPIRRHLKDTKLCIYLESGNICEHDIEIPATDEQLTFMITHLNHSIKKIGNSITNQIMV